MNLKNLQNQYKEKYLNDYDTNSKIKTINYWGEELLNLRDVYKTNGEARKAKIFHNAAFSVIKKQRFDFLEAIMGMRHVPPTIQEFCESNEYLSNQLYRPKIREMLYECYPDVLAGEDPVTEVIHGGSMGQGKTFFMQVGACYSLLYANCFENIRRVYGMAEQTVLVAGVLSDGQTETYKVFYEPCRKMFLSMPYVIKHVPVNKRKESALEIGDNNELLLSPMLATSKYGKKAIAYFFVGMDEMNHQPIITNSKKRDTEDTGGLLDVAERNYRTLESRIQTRFGAYDFNFTKMIVAGSARVEDDFTQRLAQEFTNYKEHCTRVYEYALWEVKKFEDEEFFNFRLSDSKYPPGVIEEKDIKDDMTIRNDCPMSLYEIAITNPYKFQKDFIGKGAKAVNPFFDTGEIIDQIFYPKDKETYWALDLKDNTDLWKRRGNFNSQIEWNKRNIQREHPRKIFFEHTDLAVSNCKAAMAFGYLAKVEKVGNAFKAYIDVPFAYTLTPGNGVKVNIAQIRKDLIKLRDWGLNLQYISYDSFQSTESIQELENEGFYTRVISTVRDPKPFDDLKELIEQERVSVVDNKLLSSELRALEEIVTGEKRVIEKPVGGSKDISDAVAGVCHNILESVVYANIKRKMLLENLDVWTYDYERKIEIEKPKVSVDDYLEERLNREYLSDEIDMWRM